MNPKIVILVSLLALSSCSKQLTKPAPRDCQKDYDQCEAKAIDRIIRTGNGFDKIIQNPRLWHSKPAPNNPCLIAFQACLISKKNA
ncbi:MAG: hypothetical protein VXZ73_03510 [Pseudomonadota bacterium]|nr:hypothetical protein [Pseudomonadota bacterium]MEC8977466.1 hypothetical protein [Pseudomonadota bacterium]